MTQEEKDLLLRDLCGRLPYGVKLLDVSYKKYGPLDLLNVGSDGSLLVDAKNEDIQYYPIIENVKPYLRKMSSMTEDEGKELEDLFHKIDAPCWVDTEYGYVNFAGGNDFIDTEIAEVYTDWLNKKMFDYRELIEKNLALEA